MALKKFKVFKFDSLSEAIAAIIAVLVFIGFASYMMYSVKKNTSFTKFNQYYARFNDVDGIAVGSDIKLAGYKVGSVLEINVVPESYDVRISFSISEDIKIPTDSTLAVKTSGIIGGKYLSLIPGVDETYLNKGQEVVYTQSAINLENLIGKFVDKA